MADTWCEIRMWKGIGVETKSEIMSMLSSIPFFIWPFYGVPRDIPFEMIMMQCCMCHIGLGTIVFHSGLPNPLNTLMDYYPMIMTSVLLMYIYVSYLFRIKAKFFFNKVVLESYLSMLLFVFCLTCWGLFLCYGIQSDFQAFVSDSFPGGKYLHWTNALNIIMVFPLILIFFYFSIYYLPLEYVYRAWLLLGVSEFFYFINYLACQYSYWLGIFHGVYHAGMCVALWYVACVGLTLRGEWELVGLKLQRIELNNV